jgi:hypothetical protein
VPRKPPACPRSVSSKAARVLWRELYAEPVAELWRDTDRALVLRLILLRLRLEAEGLEAPGWVYAATSSLEDRLLLNPRARRAAGVVYVSPASDEREKPGTVRLDERRRAKIARGG